MSPYMTLNLNPICICTDPCAYGMNAWCCDTMPITVMPMTPCIWHHVKKRPCCPRGSVWVILLEVGKLELRWDHTEQVPDSIRIAC